MDMFIDIEQHNQWLLDSIAEKPHTITIASYGIYAGISYTGQDTTQLGSKYQIATRDIMQSMKSVPNVRFLIGISDYKSCKGSRTCIDCEKQYAKSLIRILYHVDMFPEFEWKISNSLHLKSCIFEFEDRTSGISGGRNFTNSQWHDCSFVLSDDNCRQLLQHIDCIWKASREANDASLSEIFEEQGISQRGLDSLTADV